MNILRPFQLRMFLLIFIQFLTVLAAVLLLQRMAPAIDRIVKENVASLQSVEQMLAVLAQAEPRIGEDERRAFDIAFSQAREHVTLPSEPALITRISELREPSFEGDLSARAALVEALQSLGEVNRRGIERAGRDAQRLGLGGSWAIVLFGVLSLISGLAITRSLATQLISPIEELSHALNAWRHGDFRRRCNASGTEGPLDDTMKAVNELLDASS